MRYGPQVCCSDAGDGVGSGRSSPTGVVGVCGGTCSVIRKSESCSAQDACRPRSWAIAPVTRTSASDWVLRAGRHSRSTGRTWKQLTAAADACESPPPLTCTAPVAAVGVYAATVLLVVLASTVSAQAGSIAWSTNSPSLTLTYDWELTKTVGGGTGSGSSTATFTVSADCFGMPTCAEHQPQLRVVAAIVNQPGRGGWLMRERGSVSLGGDGLRSSAHLL